MLSCGVLPESGGVGAPACWNFIYNGERVERVPALWLQTTPQDAQDDVIKLFDLFDAHLGLERYIEFGLPKAALSWPLFSMLSGSISTSSVWVGTWLVTMISPALSSACTSVISKTAGGLHGELAIVWCCVACFLVASSVMSRTSSATSKSEVGTQSESLSAKFTVRWTRHKASRTGAPAQV